MNHWTTKNLDELFEIGGKKLVSELVDLFVEETAVIIQKLNEAMRANKQEVIGQIAHKLKSSAGSLGLNELADHCLKMDSKRREGLEVLPSEVEQLIYKIESSKELLINYKKQKN